MRGLTQEDIESVFRYFHAAGTEKGDLFQIMNEWVPWVSDQELEELWRSRPQKVVVQ